jgi:hypothetical protein
VHMVENIHKVIRVQRCSQELGPSRRPRRSPPRWAPRPSACARSRRSARSR